MKSDTFPTLQAKHRRVIIHHFSPKKKAHASQTCLYICSLNPPQVCTWPCTSAPCCLAVSAWSMPASPDEIRKVGYGKLEMIEWILGFLHHLLTNPPFFLHHLTISDITSNHIFVTTSKVWKPTKTRGTSPPPVLLVG